MVNCQQNNKIIDERARRQKIAEKGLYLPANEHDSCGVGMVVSIDAQSSRRVVEYGITALKAVWHRGAVDADGKTGDGAGILTQIPLDFFHEKILQTGSQPIQGKNFAVGMVFLPRTDFNAQEKCRTIVESEILQMGHTIYGWRHVPVNTEVLGEKADATRPEIEQILFADNLNLSEEAFEQNLYVIRRRIEKAVVQAQISGMYICSLSCQSIVYKGMMLAEQVAEFYPDLKDENFISSYALYHQRYSTNTFPQWWLAQPFRMTAHNGEINTINGNLNWLKSHEIKMVSGNFGDHADDIKPIVSQGSSDSAALDAVFEVMIRAGRSAPMTKSIMIPEAWSKKQDYMPKAWQDMYNYCNAVMEPWDGPASVVMSDGRWLVAGLDRNGLRPLRYAVTSDNLLLAGSETGMIPLPESTITEKGALGPGQMVAVDIYQKKLYHDQEIKDLLANSQPFAKMTETIRSLDGQVQALHEKTYFSGDELLKRQSMAGVTLEEIESILVPMVQDAKEVVISMGDDTPPAVLSDKYRPMSHYFRQNFSQVTNPPIDSLREHGVMSLITRFGNLNNVLDTEEQAVATAMIQSPVLSNAMFESMSEFFSDDVAVLDCTFDPNAGEKALEKALEAILVEAEKKVCSGFSNLVLTDMQQGPQAAPMPMILVTSAVHSSLTAKGLRTFTSLNVRSGECLDPHYFAVLIGCGATTVNAYLAQDTLAEKVKSKLLKLSLKEAVDNYREAINQGLLKIMSKMGISVISSYRGGLNFEALGLSRAMVAKYFPGMASRISGIGLEGLQRILIEQHQKSWSQITSLLPVGGFYKLRNAGEKHAWKAREMHQLQAACEADDYELWRSYSNAMKNAPPLNLRDLLQISALQNPISLSEVDSITAIRKRFVTPGMSLGALSPEAHRTLNVAMNRIGAKSDSGEGGEDPAHATPDANGDNPSAKIKQVASGRFGVTAEYLSNCEELEIKIAQGAKPGEGGQLPGMKVTDLIAKLRHSTKGVTLISPPPHHDIYSIEDLAQLIYDLKQINPRAKVCVKLVSSSGIGTIAAGVAKAKADVILISGHSGGTGASPATSIKFAGLPWEIGLAECHQVLTLNKLRDRVILRTDGGLRTGRDIVIAALLGAEEYGIGTAALIAMGCMMVRQCQSNTCPVGVCTQDEKLRQKFTGTVDKVVNLISFYAREVREILAEMGVRSLDEVIGRTDLLTQTYRGSELLVDLDLNPLLVRVDENASVGKRAAKPRNEVPESLDQEILNDANAFFEEGEKMQLSYVVRNTVRTIGARTSHYIVKKFGMNNSLQSDHLTIKLSGSAGQSLGAFAVNGLKLILSGDANDYVGKGLSGGTIVVFPPTFSHFESMKNTIIGNTVLYGATNGKMFAAGRAGERFCVRNSGAVVVVEGCGANGCEYMTGGVAVILGSIEANFGAGMTGGMAYLYDPHNEAPRMINKETLVYCKLSVPYWRGQLYNFVVEHAQETNSSHAKKLLNNWEVEEDNFIQICPKEMLHRIPYPIVDLESQLTA
ncbi:MAG: glutamate synthase large subunit [Rhodobacteraceae bacterium]|nr:glutamate synthase large subunit [Paracoccaceae bacterium]